MPFDRAAISGKGADILLLTSCGNSLDDLTVIRNVRVCQPGVEVVMLGKIADDGEFLQCVRAGVRGYRPPSVPASSAQLFCYFEAEAKSLPSASIHQRMGLTRREQQPIPLVARGLTNKEIANHFSLSEQT